MKTVLLLITGIIIGAVVAFGFGWNQMPHMMLTTHSSTMSFDQTVSAIQEAAESGGWKVSKVYDIRKSLTEAGQGDISNVKVLSVCKPEYAYEILSDDANKDVTAMMPCRIAVYETTDGGVYVVQMNVGLMSKMFGGTIQEVMTRVSAEEREMLEGIVKY